MPLRLPKALAELQILLLQPRPLSFELMEGILLFHVPAELHILLPQLRPLSFELTECAGKLARV